MVFEYLSIYWFEWFIQQQLKFECLSHLNVLVVVWLCRCVWVCVFIFNLNDCRSVKCHINQKRALKLRTRHVVCSTLGPFCWHFFYFNVSQDATKQISVNLMTYTRPFCNNMKFIGFNAQILWQLANCLLAAKRGPKMWTVCRTRFVSINFIGLPDARNAKQCQQQLLHGRDWLAEWMSVPPNSMIIE